MDAEITSKEDGDKLADENQRRSMLHAISIIEHRIASPERIKGHPFKVSIGRTVTYGQLEEIAQMYRNTGWEAKLYKLTNGVDLYIILT